MRQPSHTKSAAQTHCMASYKAGVAATKAPSPAAHTAPITTAPVTLPRGAAIKARRPRRSADMMVLRTLAPGVTHVKNEMAAKSAISCILRLGKKDYLSRRRKL